MTVSEQPFEKTRIRSFILRQGRTTVGQKRAIATLWETYCLSPNQTFEAKTVFNNSAPVIMEIGFGKGDSLAKMAAKNPEKNFIGIDVHKPGVGHLMHLLATQKLTNVRIFHHDAIEILEKCIHDHALAGIQLFFPDPWHKRRHHKRRIVSPYFMDLITQKLASGGKFHVATDWKHYANEILNTLNAHTEFINQDSKNGYCKCPENRPITKFEQRGLRLGHGIWDLIFSKR
jgi:tRNA (guanine-N7-)-methyltransferase